MTRPPSAPTVRPAKPADAAGWLLMRRDLWPEEPGDDHTTEIDEWFAGRRREPLAVLVAEDEAGLTGFAELSIRRYAEGCDTDHVAFLEGWYVAARARRNGVGRALVKAAEVWGRAQGCREFASDAYLENEISAAAHLAVGFTEVGRIRCFRKPL